MGAGEKEEVYYRCENGMHVQLDQLKLCFEAKMIFIALHYCAGKELAEKL